MAGFTALWVSVDQPERPAPGWYAVLRIAPRSGEGVRGGAFHLADEGWGAGHDIFARSAQVFADAAAAEDFARSNAMTVQAADRGRDQPGRR